MPFMLIKTTHLMQIPLNNKDIHQWDLKYNNYKNIYIKPIVDYKKRRQLALDTYKKVV
jgi:deoxyribodipyrimidine photolyase